MDVANRWWLHRGYIGGGYMHVSDLADAHVAAIEWLAAGHPSDPFNLGNGRGFSVAEVVATSEKVTGRPVKTELCARRPGDPPILVSDSSKAGGRWAGLPNSRRWIRRSCVRGHGSVTGCRISPAHETATASAGLIADGAAV